MNAPRLSLINCRWHFDQQVINRGTAAEGLLMNVRMVNATFEDPGRPEFDAEGNTDHFISAVPSYVGCGINAFTLNLQGGMPGYEGARNSAFAPDGSLREAYLQRVDRVIRAIGAAGAAVILGLFYQRQSGQLQDERAVRRGVENAARWVREQACPHVMIEVANEFGHPGYRHDCLKDDAAVAALIETARGEAPGLLVSASRQSHRGDAPAVYAAADVVLIHFNQLPLEQIAALVRRLRGQYGKAVVCNEDRKVGPSGAAALRASVSAGAGWGLMAHAANQYLPAGARRFRFDGPADEPAVYQALAQVTGRPRPPL